MAETMKQTQDRLYHETVALVERINGLAPFYPSPKMKRVTFAAHLLSEHSNSYKAKVVISMFWAGSKVESLTVIYHGNAEFEWVRKNLVANMKSVAEEFES